MKRGSARISERFGYGFSAAANQEKVRRGSAMLRIGLTSIDRALVKAAEGQRGWRRSGEARRWSGEAGEGRVGRQGHAWIGEGWWSSD